MRHCSWVVVLLALLGFGCGNSPTSPTVETVSCEYIFSPAKVVVSSLSQRVIVQVRTGPSCSWMAITASAWMHSSYQGNKGTGDLILNLDPNQCTSKSRTGFFFIKGSGSENFLEVVQDGSDLGVCP